MKKTTGTIFLIIFTYLFSHGQFVPQSENCRALTKTIKDDVTGIVRIASEYEMRVNDLSSGDMYQLAFIRNGEEISILIKSIKKRCYAAQTKVIFHFRNGQQLNCNSNNKENCESILLVKLGKRFQNERYITSFLEKYLIGIEFPSLQGETKRLKIETPNNELIQETFDCLTTGMKLNSN